MNTSSNEESAGALAQPLFQKLADAIDWYFGCGRADFWILRPNIRFLEDPTIDLAYWCFYAALAASIVYSLVLSNIHLKLNYRKIVDSIAAINLLLLVTPLFKTFFHYGVIAFYNSGLPDFIS